MFGDENVEMMANGMLLNDQKGTLTLATLEGSRFVFDFRTGQIISSRRPLRVVLSLVAFALIALYAAYLAARLRAPGWRTNVRAVLASYGTGVLIMALVVIYLQHIWINSDGMGVGVTACWRGVIYLPVSLWSALGLGLLSFWTWFAVPIVFWSAVLLVAMASNQALIFGLRYGLLRLRKTSNSQDIRAAP